MTTPWYDPATEAPTLRMRRRRRTAEASSEGAESNLPAWLEAPTRPGEDPEPDTAIRPGPGLVREEVDLVLYGELLAAMHRSPDRRTELLDAEGVSTTLWRRASSRWEQVLMLAARIGDEALLDRFDEAYLSRLGAERGRAVDVATYASLEVASEIGRLPSALVREGLPRDAVHVVQRFWYRRMLESEQVLRRATIALLEARERSRAVW